MKNPGCLYGWLGETDISRVIHLVSWTRPVLICPALSWGFGPEWKPKIPSKLHYSVILTSLNICYTIRSAPFSPASIQMISLGRGSCVLDVCTQTDGSQYEQIEQKTQGL